jgi:hypothetical protein
MPDETEPTPAAPATDEERPADRTDENAAARTGVQVPKWLAVGVVVIALAGGGFAIGRATASDHHGRMAPIGRFLPGEGQGPGGGFGGRGGPGFGPGGDRNGPGPGGDSNSNGNDGSNDPTPPSTTPATTGTTGA